MVEVVGEAMGALTVLGGHGVLGSRYVANYYHHAVGNIASVNTRNDYRVYSPDVLYFIHDFHGDTTLTTLARVLENWRSQTCEGVFNYISTVRVYESKLSSHAREKLSAERLVVSFCKLHKLDYRILRAAHVIGTRDTRQSFRRMVNSLMSGQSIEVYNGGNYYRDHIHIEDAVRAIELVISKGERNTVYNIGTGKGWLYKDALKCAAGKAYSPDLLKSIKANPTPCMDLTKLKKLGFVPEYIGERLYRSESV
jgi:nucleoside-diphosphate-sugar epimerase